MDERTTDARAILALLGGALLIGGAVVALLWIVTGRVSETTLRLWALVGTLVIMPAVWLGFWFGSRRETESEAEARGTLVGIQAGVRQVMSAAQGTADIRVHTIERVRQVTQPAVQQPPVIVLPQLGTRIAARQLGSGDETVAM